jgi:hypothetical protein
MKYTTNEKSYIDDKTKKRALIGNITITNLNEMQFNKIRDLVITLYNDERENEEKEAKK